jgi:hypothetical protein
MKVLTRWIYILTIAAWFLLCVRFWALLIDNAALDPELYVRSPGFQLINFVVQYLWFFVVVLGIVIAFEWAILRLLRFVISRIKDD